MMQEQFSFKYPSPSRLQYRKFLKRTAKPLNAYIHRHYCIYKSQNAYFQELRPRFDEEILNHRLSWHNQHASEEAQACFVYDVPLPALIEPGYGWAFVEPFLMLDRALTFNYDIPLPSIRQYARTRLCKHGRIERHDAVISLRTHGDCSYSHTVNDVFGKIALLQSLNSLERYPFVISHALSQCRPFRQAIARMGISINRFIVQTDQYIACRRIIYAKTEGYTRNTFDAILAMLNVPEPLERGTKRLFLYRAATRTRRISNFHEIENVCKVFDMRVVDPESMSYEEQIILLADAQLLVGVHGAGFVNMMFRQGKQLSLLEIFPQSLISPHNYWLASQFGYRYDAMTAENDHANNYVQDAHEVRIDVEKLKRKLDALMNT